MMPQRAGASRRWVVASLLGGALLFAHGAPRWAHAQAGPKVEPPVLVSDSPAEYPKSLVKQGLRGKVVVLLTIGTDGLVEAAKIAQGAHPDFDAAALAAAQGLVFTPALVDGEPRRVQIQFGYSFRPEDRLDRRPSARSKGSFGRRGAELAPEGFLSLQGTILEKGTGRPVVGAVVTILELDKEAVTDESGQYGFGLLPPGRYTLQLTGVEHRPADARVRVESGKTSTLDTRLRRRSYTVYRATAEAPPEPGEIARRRVTVEEIQKIPGVNGDSFKVVQNLPGVARAPGLSGLIVVRGSAPQDSQVLVEGVPVPLLYHFGGVYSVVNTDILEAIDFQPGGYPVRYGRRTGGLLQARLALPRENERWTGYWETNVYHSGFFLKGGIGEATTVTLAARRSYIDALLTALPPGTLPFTLAPRYWDYQAKIDHRFSKRFDMTLLFLGSDDRLRLILDEPPAAFPDARGGVSTATTFNGGLAIARYRGDGWSTRSTFGLVRNNFNIAAFDAFRFNLKNWDINARQDFELGEPSDKLRWRAGMDIQSVPFDIEVLAPPLVSTGEPGTDGGEIPSAQDTIFTTESGNYYYPALWFDSIYKPRDDLEVVPGVRFDMYRKYANGASLLPKLNVRYTLDEQWVLKGATGRTSQPPQPQELSRTFGNARLFPFYSWESALGFEYRPLDYITIDIQGFYKRLDDVIAVPPGLFPDRPFDNIGRGRIYGAEVLVRHELFNRFFGWIAYTLQRAERRDNDGEPWRLFGFDQTHILTVLGTYKLPADWEVGLRFRLVTGNPITEVQTAVWNEQSDNYTQVNSSCINCGRLPSFNQLDLRVDKKFVFDRWMLGVYLDIQNVYNRMNPEDIDYNFDATRSRYFTGLPIIPSLGFRAEF